MRSDVSLHGTVGVGGDAGAPGVDGTEDAQAAEHDVQQITAAFAQFLEHKLLLASSAHVTAEFPMFVFSCWSSSVQEDDMEAVSSKCEAARARTRRVQQMQQLQQLVFLPYQGGR